MPAGTLTFARPASFVRWWDFAPIDSTELTDDNPVFMMEPLQEVCIAPGAKLSGLLRGPDHWVVQDATGAVWRLPLQDLLVSRLQPRDTVIRAPPRQPDASPTPASQPAGGEAAEAAAAGAEAAAASAAAAATAPSAEAPAEPSAQSQAAASAAATAAVQQVRAELLASCHAGDVAAVDVCPVEHVAATAGEDGTVRCWDYVGQRELFSRRFLSKPSDSEPARPVPATALVWAPTLVDSQARTVAVGFANGVLRVLQREEMQWRM